MPSCCSRARASASSSKRRSIVPLAPPAMSGRISLIATRRRGRCCWATQTSPMPPPPSLWSSLYAPDAPAVEPARASAAAGWREVGRGVGRGVGLGVGRRPSCCVRSGRLSRSKCESPALPASVGSPPAEELALAKGSACGAKGSAWRGGRRPGRAGRRGSGACGPDVGIEGGVVGVHLPVADADSPDARTVRTDPDCPQSAGSCKTVAAARRGRFLVSSPAPFGAAASGRWRSGGEAPKVRRSTGRAPQGCGPLANRGLTGEGRSAGPPRSTGRGGLVMRYGDLAAGGQFGPITSPVSFGRKALVPPSCCWLLTRLSSSPRLLTSKRWCSALT